MIHPQDSTVTIIGSGPTGLALALSLKKIGINATVFEQRSREQVIKGSEDRSVNITLSSRGVSILMRLGCLEKFMKVSVDVVGRTYFINDKPYFVPYTLLPGYSLRSIKRKDLEHIMIQVAEDSGVKIKFGHKLSEVNTYTRTCTFLHGGRSIQSGYSFLFGADGVNSKVRDSLCIPYSMSRPDHVYKKIEISCENAARLGLHKNTVTIWPNPKGMLLSLPNKNGSHSGLLHIRGSILDEVCINPKLLHAYFPILIRDISNFITKFNSAGAGAFGTISCDKWSLRKNIVLLGDAAHAITPFYGQGTNCGLEDAIMVSDIIRDNSGDIERAIAIFQEIRPEDMRAISQLSVQNLKNLEVEQSFEDYMTFKSLDLVLEQEFPEYFSEYFLVAFSDTPFSEVLQISNNRHPVLSAYAQHDECKGKNNFSQKILQEIYTKLITINKG